MEMLKYREARQSDRFEGTSRATGARHFEKNSPGKNTATINQAPFTDYNKITRDGQGLFLSATGPRYIRRRFG